LLHALLKLRLALLGVGNYTFARLARFASPETNSTRQKMLTPKATFQKRHILAVFSANMQSKLYKITTITQNNIKILAKEI
jgi:hypothetical protein